jgi:hypothetical protein
MEAEGLVIQPPHPIPQWVNYYLTEKGKKVAEEATKRNPHETLKSIKTIAEEVSKLSFYKLLRKVYTEAPEFAVNSIFKGVIK